MRNILAYLGFAIVAVGVVLYIAQDFIQFWPYSGGLALIAVLVVGWGIYSINKIKEKEEI